MHRTIGKMPGWGASWRRAGLGFMAAVLVSLALTAPSERAKAAGGVSSLDGTATEVGGEVTIESVGVATAGSIDYVPVVSLTFADITTLSAEFNPTDDSCGGGAPRFAIGVDGPDIDTAVDGHIVAYFGNLPNYTSCGSGWQSTGDLTDASDTRWEWQQLGGPFYGLYSDALAAFGTYDVLYVVLAVDGGWSQLDLEQTFKFKTVTINADVFPEPEAACSSECWVDGATGNDVNAGNSGSPKATIQAAIDAVDAEGTVYVRPGTGNYSETAAGRTLQTGGTYTFGLFVSDAKPGVAIQGVDGSDTPITDASLVLATVNTNATNGFGPSGVFIEGDNVSMKGLRLGTNSAGQNKTIEVIGDNFTLADSEVADPNGSVYISSFAPDGSGVSSYHIVGNIFAAGLSVDLASGAGLTGPVSGREIKNNEFDGTDAFWPLISFNGSGTGVPWFVFNVGGAEITGNTFSNGEQYIRARGDYPNADFDWESYWKDNTYDKAVITLKDAGTSEQDVLTFDPEEFSYALVDGPSTYTFNHVRRIGAVIQGEIDHTLDGDTVLVKQGTYPEQLDITKSISLVGDGAVKPIILAPASLTGDRNLVTIRGAGVSAEITNLVISGPGPTGCGSIVAGIVVRDDAYAHIHGNEILDIRDNPFSGCQNGLGILVGRNLWSTSGSALIEDNLIQGYQKGGIVVDGVGSSAEILDNTITGAGATTIIAQNGIQISRGATALVQGNSISANDYPPDSWEACGLLLYEAGGVKASKNKYNANEENVCNEGKGGGHYNPDS